LKTSYSEYLSDIEVKGNTASFKLAEGKDWFRLARIKKMFYDPCRIVFRKDLIEEMKCEATDESKRVMSEIWQSFVEWASQERSEELATLMPKGEFVYDAVNARKWIGLLREWREVNI
jgi:hypothetical protein